MTQNKQTETLSVATWQATALWPPVMHLLLRGAVHSTDPAERERLIMRLLVRYTRLLDDPLQKRWIEVK